MTDTYSYEAVRGRPRLFSDVDGVIADLLGGWLDWWGKSHGYTRADITNYDLVELTRREESTAMLLESGFFRSLAPFPDAVEAVNRLREGGFEVVFVTSLPDNSTTAYQEKVEWLRRYFPWVKPRRDIIFTQSRHLLRGDGAILVDDRPENLVGFTGGRVLMGAPYNAWVIEPRILGIHRVYDWKELEAWLRQRQSI